jgi:site-specific DNA-cytosine methylase
MKAIGVCIYAGGFSLGVKKHFEIAAHLEDPQPYGFNVINMNREKYWGNISIWPYPNWKAINADLLFANPPCAPFSNANTRSFEKDSWRKDPRIKCWHNTASYAIKHDIPFVAIETIPQAYSKAPSMLMEKAEEFAFEGYQCHIFLHNAMFMGSCQNRPRLMFIATKKQLYLSPYDSEPTTTVEEKLGEGYGLIGGDNDFFIRCASKYLNLLSAIKPGERMRNTWERVNPQPWELNERGQVKGRPTFGVKRLESKKQMNTIVGYSIVHPTENRYLTVKEYQILGDYPPDYNFPKGQNSLSLVARGVSSKVGEWIGKTAKLTLEKNDEPDAIDLLRIHNGLQGMDSSSINHVPIGPGASFPSLSLRSKGYK